MTNNDVFRRIRYIYDLTDKRVIKLFALGGHEASRTEISDWLKQDDDDAFKNLNDRLLARFLNGLIVDKRGKKEGVEMIAEKRLDNNIVLRKLKIALNLTAEDMLDIIELTEFGMSKHELSAFFRKPGHKHYRECKDQILRNFLNGMKLKYRDKIEPAKTNPWNKN
ncbi:MAG: DUF1456 family protein [Pseudomonadales bacterium]|nr:DUF1456 family protein [Pseudomonadales bacterium]